MNNQQIALLLSGGGFRATLFHLGAMKRLHELGVLDRVTIISSVSGGSIIAAVYCHMLSDKNKTFVFEEFENRIIQGIKTNMRGKIKYYFSPNSLETALKETFGFNNILIEGLPNSPKLIINTTGLYDGKAYHLQKNSPFEKMPLAKAVAASSAFPIIFKPVVEGKLVLVDGGVLDNRCLQSLGQMEGKDLSIILSDGSRVLQPHPAKPLRLGRLNVLNQLLSSSQRERIKADETLFSNVIIEHISRYCGFEIADKFRIGSTDAQNLRYFLPSRYIDWFLYEKNKVSLSREKPDQSDYYPMRLVNFLSEIRTDFDAFDDLEIRCLMYQGYVQANSALLFGCWQILPDSLKEKVTPILVHLSDSECSIDQMNGVHFGDFLVEQNCQLANGELKKEDAFPLPMTWREFNNYLESKGLVKDWQSLGNIENLNKPNFIEKKIIRKAEWHLWASGVNLVIFLLFPRLRWWLKCIARLMG